MKLQDRTTLLPWDPVAFSPLVQDPVAQYLAAVYHGEATTPFGHRVFSTLDLAIELEKDPVAWDWLGQKLSEMVESLTAYLRGVRDDRNRLASVRRVDMRSKILTSSSRVFQTGGTLPGEPASDKYWLRIPESTQALVAAIDRVLLAGVGFPAVALQVRHGKSYPVWILGDVSDLYGKAWDKRMEPRTGPGRPHKPWRVAYELEREGTGAQWAK
jgi:hypothetical protein